MFAHLGSAIPSSSSSPPSPPASHPLLVHFLAGNTAGAVSGVVLNQFTAIKYASWEKDSGGFFVTARHMWRQGGVQPFMKGIVPTVLRDTIFGGVFALSKEGCARLLNAVRERAWLSKEQKHRRPTTSPPSPPPSPSTLFARQFSRWSDSHVGTITFVSSLIAGALGTIASSPFNFVRNIKYGWPPNATPPPAAAILSQLREEAIAKRQEEGLRSALSFVQERLRIGWGTARVAVGMAIGYEIYEVTKAALDKANTPAVITTHPPLSHSTDSTTTARTVQGGGGGGRGDIIRLEARALGSAVDGGDHSVGGGSGGVVWGGAASTGGHGLLELPDASASLRPTGRPPTTRMAEGEKRQE